MTEIMMRLNQDWNTKTKGAGPIREPLFYRCGDLVWAELQKVPAMTRYFDPSEPPDPSEPVQTLAFRSARAIHDPSLAPNDFISSTGDK